MKVVASTRYLISPPYLLRDNRQVNPYDSTRTSKRNSLLFIASLCRYVRGDYAEDRRHTRTTQTT